MRGKLAGSSEYMTKPFDSAELVQVVKRYLESVPVRERAALRARQQQRPRRRMIY
jgi:twitching motility two-component system response regulator PilG